MATLLEHFDLYVKIGLKPIAIFKGTKCPIGNNWNKDWSVEKWRSYFNYNDYNMGILLGDIIDVEADTEESNDLLLRMIDDMPHPMFRSSKSIHHLFINPDKNLTRSVYGGIEFRGHLHQSVLPPSIHSDGSRYRWLLKCKFPIPQMPDELLRYYLANKKEDKPHRVISKTKKRKVKENYKRTECRICKNKFYIHKKRLILEVKSFKEYNLPWMCHGCREIDMREPCRVLRKKLEKELKKPFIPYRMN